MQQTNFLLQILLLAQHVSGTFTPIIRSSRVLYKWLLSVVLYSYQLWDHVLSRWVLRNWSGLPTFDDLGG
jgi:hypothetical protein